MDTHSRRKHHQTENNSDGAGPVPEPDPALAGITVQKDPAEETVRFFLADEKATENFGKLLGSLAADGDVYCLSGDLGAGKTAFTRGVCKGLGVKDGVSSPVALTRYDAPSSATSSSRLRLAVSQISVTSNEPSSCFRTDCIAKSFGCSGGKA